MRIYDSTLRQFLPYTTTKKMWFCQLENGYIDSFDCPEELSEYLEEMMLEPEECWVWTEKVLVI